jgi:hypothetical protein
MPKAEEKNAPIRQSVHVDCPIEDAFRLFAERFGEWWPLASYSTTGEEAESCAIEPWEGGRVFERARSGEEREWGAVIAWEPPRRAQFRWHPGTDSDKAGTVDVEFSVEADGTRVTLIHSGWHRTGVESCAFGADLKAQWSGILSDCFGPFVLQQTLVAV